MPSALRFNWDRWAVTATSPELAGVPTLNVGAILIHLNLRCHMQNKVS